MSTRNPSTAEIETLSKTLIASLPSNHGHDLVSIAAETAKAIKAAFAELNTGDSQARNFDFSPRQAQASQCPCKQCAPVSDAANIESAQWLLKSLESREMSDVQSWINKVTRHDTRPHVALRAARKGFLTVLRLLGLIPSCPEVEHLPLSDRRPAPAPDGRTASIRHRGPEEPGAEPLAPEMCGRHQRQPLSDPPAPQPEAPEAGAGT